MEGLKRVLEKFDRARVVILGDLIIDQYIWGDLVADLGVGPKGVPIAKLTGQALEPRLLDLWRNPSYKAEVQELAERIQAEDYREQIGDAVLS